MLTKIRWLVFFNPLPHCKIFDTSIMEAFVGDNLNTTRFLLKDWKTFWEKWKMLVTNKFSYQNVFISLTSPGFLISLDFVVEGKLQPITRRQNFRLVQIETNCRQHFKAHLKRKISAI